MYAELSFFIWWWSTFPRAVIIAQYWVPHGYTGMTHLPGLSFSFIEMNVETALPFAKYPKWSYSVVSDSLQPHGLKPTRLLCPWDFPGKNTRVGCHFLLQGIFPTQGWNPGLPHCRQMLYHLSHQGSQSDVIGVRENKDSKEWWLKKKKGEWFCTCNKTTKLKKAMTPRGKG